MKQLCVAIMAVAAMSLPVRAGDFAAHGYQMAGAGGAAVATPDGQATIIVPEGWVWRYSKTGSPKIEILPGSAPDEALRIGQSAEVPSCQVLAEAAKLDSMTQADLNQRSRDIVARDAPLLATQGDTRLADFERIELLSVSGVDGVFLKDADLDLYDMALIGLSAEFKEPTVRRVASCSVMTTMADPPFHAQPDLPVMEAMVRSLTFAPD